jgi:hypothetical protein
MWSSATKRDRKSLQQILQIFIFNVDRLRTLWMKKRWWQNVPLENCRWSHLTLNPNILMLIPFIYKYPSIFLNKNVFIKICTQANLYLIIRGGTTRWCRVQIFTCCSTGSRHQYIVIWWGWHYRIFSVLLGQPHDCSMSYWKG